MRGQPRTLAITLAVATLTATSVAMAQEPLGIDAPSSGPPAAGGTEQAVVARYWELGRPRLFGAMILESGYAYAKPRFSLGYGQPYWKWIGIEANPIVSLKGIGHYGGVAAMYPGVSLRLGARYSYPFSAALLPEQETYTRTDLDLEGPRASYLALEGDLGVTVPVWVGSLFAVGTVVRAEGVDEGYYLFEETLRAVMKPPWIWRARVGYLLTFGRNGAIRAGLAGDYIGLPGRGESVIRIGPLASVAINAHLEAQASLIPVIVSPDSIGLAGGDFGQLGIRFRWATGSTPDPERVRRWREEQAGKAEALPLEGKTPPAGADTDN